uniref:Damage-control phosphatase ARMT1-like metal-binding domain-containing protein n=1 Tax=Fagus sylvatica TaxID=28930 RepID=A0A2N9HV52_FAGSY
MESASEMVAFPLLPTPIESNYRACTIPYRFPSDNPRKPTPTELSWIDLFLNSIPSFKKRAESDPTVPDAPIKADKFAQRYAEILEDFKKDPESHGGPPDCILLCRIREQILRELGFRDIFKKVKDVVLLNDSIEDGGKASRESDIILGILPFARELLRRGTQVVLAANDLPSINDVTYPELIEIISKLKDEHGQLMGVDTSNLLISNSGNDLPVIDLSRVSEELAYLSSDADLVVLEGMVGSYQLRKLVELKSIL